MVGSTGVRTRREDRRAQSEVVGVLLLTAVVVVLVGVVGAGVIANFSSQAEAGAGVSADATVEITADNVTVTHAGGDALADSAVEVIIRNGSYEEQYDLADALTRTGDGDGQFEPGERATLGHGFSPGEVTVLVIDRDKNAVLRRADRMVPTDGPANFTVRIDNTNAPVTEGDRLKVRVTVENTGDRRATQTVDLAIDGNQNDTQDLTLDGGEAEQVTLTWDTGTNDNGTYTATVNSLNESADTSVQVLTPANFTVSIAGSNSPVVEGNTAYVNATIENTGESPDIQIVNLSVESQTNPVNFTYLGLNGLANRTLTFGWETEEGDGGPGRSAVDYTATVNSYENSDSTTITVEGSGGGGGPTAEAGGPYTVDEGSSVTLDGSGSAAGTGNIQDYSWKILSGGPGTLTDANSEQATYNAPGNVNSDTDVTVELTVTNNKGDTDTDTTTVTVSDTPDAPSVGNLTVTENGRRFDVSADVSDPTNDGNDLQDVTVRVIRTQNSKEVYSGTVPVSGDSASITDTTSRLSKNQQYEIRVTVSDTAGNTATKSETKTVS